MIFNYKYYISKGAVLRILFIFMFIFLQISFAANVPQWFFNLPKERNQIIGYGTSKSLEEAKKSAKNEVATIISTKVDSYMNLEKFSQGDKITKKFEKSITITTNISLENVQVIRSEHVDDTWYIAASYDLSSFALQVKKMLGGTALVNEKQNRYLSQTPLVKSLNEIIGKTLNYNIYIKDNIWWLSYKDQAIKIPKNNLHDLFAFKDSKYINIQPNKNVFKSNEEISFDIVSRKKGFVTLFYVNEAGNVGRIFENQQVENKLIYPTQSRVIVKNQLKEQKRFMLVALFTKKREQFKEIVKVDKNKLENYDIPKLLQILNNYDHATYVCTVVN